MSGIIKRTKYNCTYYNRIYIKNYLHQVRNAFALEALVCLYTFYKDAIIPAGLRTVMVQF